MEGPQGSSEGAPSSLGVHVLFHLRKGLKDMNLCEFFIYHRRSRSNVII